MKFYRTIVPVMFCIVYTATIFGMEESSIYIGKDTLDLIDEFRSDDDKTVLSYEKTDHVEIRDKEKEADRATMVSRSQDLIVFEYKFFDSDKTEKGFLSLSGMERKEFTGEFKNETSHEFDSFCDELSEGLVQKDKQGRDQLVLRLLDDKVNMHIFQNRSELDCIGELKTAENLRDYTASEDGKTIVACGKGHIYKWELRKKFEKGLKMSEIYPGGRIRVSGIVLKHGVGQKIFEKDDIGTDE